MGSDLFGSYAESSCAALVVASISSFGINHEFTAMLYPLLVSSIGILVCLFTTLFATDDSWHCYCYLDCSSIILHNFQLWYSESSTELAIVHLRWCWLVGWTYYWVCHRVLH
nr:pyrophosphate-energized vacuolar membrane proton pump-like [Ipomoea batatas]